MMLFVAYISIPPLIYCLSMHMTANRKQSVVCMYLATITILAYFQDVIPWGLVPGLCSIPLFLISWIFLEKTFKTQRFSSTVLLFTLGVLLYLHLYSFIITLCFLFSRAIFEIFFCKKKAFTKKLSIGLLLLTIFAIPFIYFLWLYYPYIHFNRTGFSFHQSTLGIIADNLAHTGSYTLFLPVILFHNPYIRVIWLCLPIAVLGALSPTKQKTSYLCFLSFAILLLLTPLILYTLGIRAAYFAPLFIALISGPWVVRTNGKLSLVRLLLIVLISSFSIQPDTIGAPIVHIKSMGTFHPKLIEKISSLDGNFLLENHSHLNPFENPQTLFEESPFPHFEAMLGFITKKRFLSHYGEDPYPYFTFREGLIVNGAFQERSILEADLNSLAAIYRKWNISYLIIWNNYSKYFFSKTPLFKKVFEDGDFQILKFENSEDSRSNASAITHIQQINQFKKEITIKNGIKNDLISLNQNYTPGWRAYYNNAPIPLLQHNGQLSFRCPKTGDIKVIVLFSRFLFMPLFIICALLISFFLELRDRKY